MTIILLKIYYTCSIDPMMPNGITKVKPHYDKNKNTRIKVLTFYE